MTERPPQYQTEHRRAYHDYLRSPAWQVKRTAVLRRAGYMCESCGHKQAREVHHTSYAYGYWTPNWLLRAVCEDCHTILTAIDNGELSPWSADEEVGELLGNLPY